MAFEEVTGDFKSFRAKRAEIEKDIETLHMPDYEPRRIFGEYTVKHVPAIVNVVLLINIILLSSVLFMPNSLAPIMARKRLSVPFFGMMMYLLVVLILDNKALLMELEDRCPAERFAQCSEDLIVKVKIKKERFRTQRDLFLAISALLSTILLLTVAHFKDKVMRLSAQLQEAKLKLNKLDPDAGKQPQDGGRNSEKKDN